MSIIDVQVRTISCNACDKTVTFNIKEHQQALDANAWLKSSRVFRSWSGATRLRPAW